MTFLDVNQKTLEFNNNRMEYTGGDGGTEHLDLAALKAGVETPEVADGERQPTIGMLGKNDCAQFAETLYNAIARAGYVQPLEPVALAESIEQMAEGYPEMNVGDMMRHIFNDGQACPWHGATVVAKDDGGIVTLEAHVSQDLDAPHFHVHDGAAGFVEANDPAARLDEGEVRGTDLEVTKYQDGSPSEDDLNRYNDFEESFAGTYRLRGGVGTTQTVEGMRAEVAVVLAAILNSGAATTFWRTQTLNRFSDDMPSSITTMRGQIAGDLDQAVATGAAAWRADKPWRRSAVTNEFYGYVREYSLAIDHDTIAAALANLRGFRTNNGL